MIELMLSIKECDMKLEELESILDIILIKEELEIEVKNELKENGFRLGLLAEEFMNIYIKFTNGIVEKGYIENDIELTRSVIKGLGYTYREIYLVKKNGGFTTSNCKYLKSKEFLKDLQEELRKCLNQDINNISKEDFNILGLVEYIRNELGEYKSIFTLEYIEELNMMKI